MKKIIFTISLALIIFSCGKQENKANTTNSTEKNTINIPEFNADSAYIYTANQVAFGPRVPNTQAHKDCGNYLVSELKRFGAEVIEQEATLETYNKQAIEAKNIIASFNPENKNRVLLCAHWDTRPFADHDSNPANHHKAIDGANDGAGACGVLLEIARQIGIQPTSVGIDIILFDAEDWGAPAFDSQHEGGYCLGSEYWAKNPHTPDYQAKYGILLDMVSAKNARFYKESFSMYFANNVVKKVWETAHSLGYSDYFIDKRGNGVQDDHIAVNHIRKIPCIDIIQLDPDNETGFGHYWHTMKDTMDEVCTETMKATGQTVLHVIYQE